MKGEAALRWSAVVSGPAMTTRLFFSVHRTADRITRWGEEESVTLRCLQISWGERRPTRVVSTHREVSCDTTKLGLEAPWATEAKDGWKKWTASAGLESGQTGESI
jgi:hypothetical protein